MLGKFYDISKFLCLSDCWLAVSMYLEVPVTADSVYVEVPVTADSQYVSGSSCYG